MSAHLFMSGRTEGSDIYGVIRYGPMIVVMGVGTQQARRVLMTRSSKAGAGGRCYLIIFEVRTRKCRVTLG